MKKLVEVYQRIAPEMMEIVEERQLLLNHISYAQPIGRRMLAHLSGLSERVVRSHVEAMKDNGLLSFSPLGMELTPDGIALLPKLATSLKELNKINEIETFICKTLNLEEVIITSGTEMNSATFKELGFKAAKVLQNLMEPNQVIAVSGGSTMAMMAKLLPTKAVNAIIIPARGGIGEKVEYQANVIASVIAEKTDGTYRMLHLPDGLSSESLHILSQMEPQIREINELSRKTSVLIFGIGNALHMAHQRHMQQEDIDTLMQSGAIGEALGYYCTIDGDVVYMVNNIGIDLTAVSHIPHVIAVASGREKAKAIIGVMRACRKGILIIDEGAADEIMHILQDEF